MTYMNGLPSLLVARWTRTAVSPRPAIMPQHSFGRSATAWATSSWASSGGSFTAGNRSGAAAAGAAGRSGAEPARAHLAERGHAGGVAEDHLGDREAVHRERETPQAGLLGVVLV